MQSPDDGYGRDEALEENFNAQLASVHGDLEQLFAAMPSPDGLAAATEARDAIDTLEFHNRRRRVLLPTAVLALIAAMVLWSSLPHRRTVAEAPVAGRSSDPAASANTTASDANANAVEPRRKAPAIAIAPVQSVKTVTPPLNVDVRVRSGDRSRAPPRFHGSAPSTVSEARAEPPRSAPHARTANCSAGFEAWCLRDATAAADRNLRDAYAAAVQAGVDRRTLKRIKRQWVRYRRQANKQPRDLIRGYAGLAMDLRRITAQTNVGDRTERRR